MNGLEAGSDDEEELASGTWEQSIWRTWGTLNLDGMGKKGRRNNRMKKEVT